MKRSARAMVGVACAAILSSACYSYAPVERPAPGSTVRIHVPVRSAVAGRNVQEESVSFEGTVLSFGDSLYLQTTSRREYGAFREVFEFDTLHVDPRNLMGMEERYLSKPKTYGFVALVTAGAAGLVVAAVNAAGGSGGDGNGNGGGPVAAVIVKPIVSLLQRAFAR